MAVNLHKQTDNEANQDWLALASCDELTDYIAQRFASVINNDPLLKNMLTMTYVPYSEALRDNHSRTHYTADHYNFEVCSLCMSISSNHPVYDTRTSFSIDFREKVGTKFFNQFPQNIHAAWNRRFCNQNSTIREDSATDARLFAVAICKKAAASILQKAQIDQYVDYESYLCKSALLVNIDKRNSGIYDFRLVFIVTRKAESIKNISRMLNDDVPVSLKHNASTKD